jgi:acyl-CoA synthetase (AMP-forming)/AMP-acid ligase II
VQGPNVMLGYYKQPEETAKVLKGGWFYTGDMAWADEEGYLFFSDRKKDVIVSGGENIASREVEEALYKHPDVFRAAVFGVPDEKWGERVIAAIVPKDGMHPVAEDIRTFTKEHLAGYKVPREIIVMDQLPESGTGKVQKNELKKIYQAKKAGK